MGAHGPLFMPQPTLFTIGYSGYKLDDFLGTLKIHQINALVDVRQWASSTTFEQYNATNLCPYLAKSGITYIHMGRELGARPSDLNLYSDGRVDFEKLAKSELFNCGYARLLDGIGKNFRICLMCSQKDPLICHRAILISRCFETRNPEIIVNHLQPGKIYENQVDFGDRVMKVQSLYDHNMLYPDFAKRRALAFERQGQVIAWQLRMR